MKSIINSLLICFFVATSATGVKAQNEIPQTDNVYNLQSCIEFAIKNNPNLKSVKLQELGNDYKIEEIKSGLYPTVTGSGQYVYNYALAEQLLPGDFLDNLVQQFL
ncbi:MAG: TolC family protein [Saprospiraceae bacterium]|nr:TolC family protein [Saprospiraceae bacterium]